MSEQYQNPADTDDTEGHLRRPAAADDMERDDAMDDDTEGHVKKPRLDIDDDDDTEGHLRKPR
jgi:hypothetical protein